MQLLFLWYLKRSPECGEPAALTPNVSRIRINPFLGCEDANRLRRGSEEASSFRACYRRDVYNNLTAGFTNTVACGKVLYVQRTFLSCS